MKIRVTGDAAVVLESSEDLKSFTVEVPAGLDPTRLAAALAPVGAFEGPDHLWVTEEWLIAASGRARDAAWLEDFRKMLQFAASRGWLRESPTAIRAHLVRAH
jgi:hypothetical protein